ncbi:peptidase E [Saccharibacillus sp. O16]|nr:peptidase E [Saccharibacillus sp. O16]
MSHLLLTGCGFNTEEIKNQFLSLIHQDTAQLKVVIVTTGSPAKENNRHAQKSMQDFRDMGFQHIRFVDIEFEDPHILLDQDVVFINGGNPFALLHHARESGADEIFRTLAAQDVILIGVSAGTMVLGPNIKIVDLFTPYMNTMNLTDLQALEITDHLIFPHYGEEERFEDEAKRTIEERIAAFEAAENCQVTRLRDEEYLLISTNPTQC